MSADSPIRLEKQRGVTVLDFEPDAAQTAGEVLFVHLADVLEQLGREPATEVVVDLQELEFFGSSVLEALLRLWHFVNDRGGCVVICNASEIARDVLETAHFDTLFPLVESREAALKLVRQSTGSEPGAA